MSLLGAGQLSTYPAPPSLAPNSPLFRNSPVPRGSRGPGCVATAAGMRWTPADLVHTGRATPPGAEAEHWRQLQTRLAKPPARRPGLPGPGLHRDPRRLGLVPGCRPRPVAVSPAAPTGLRSAAGQRSWWGHGGPCSHCLVPLPCPFSAPQRSTSNKVAPKFMTLPAASLSTSPRVGFGAGGFSSSRGSRAFSSANLCSRYSRAAAAATSREERSGGWRATWKGTGAVESSAHRTEVTEGTLESFPGGLSVPPLGQVCWHSLTSVELWKWYTHSRVSRELGVPLMTAAGRTRGRRAGGRFWPGGGGASRGRGSPLCRGVRL